MITLTCENVKFLHKLLTDATGGDCNLRDYSLLDSAVKSAYQTFLGEELYPTIEEKGARLGFSLISNHAFVDGNKRIGILTMLTFLEINGVKLNATNDDIIKIGLGVASGKMGYEELLQFILDNKF